MKYNNECIRSALPKTFKDLLESIKVNFKVNPNENSYFDIKYVDDESEQIAISSEYDYEQAIKYIEKAIINTLKINISLKDMNSLDDMYDMKTDNIVAEDINSLRNPGINSTEVEVKKEIEEKEKKQEKQEKQDKKEENAEHKGYVCDGCDANPIIGSRYKCAVCEDFDFCEKCEEKNKNTHPHPFIKIRCPDRAPIKIACAVVDNKINVKKEVMISEPKLDFNCTIDMNTSLEVIIKENTDLRKQVRLINSGISTWSKFFTFVCFNNSDKNNNLKGNDITLKVAIKTGDAINLEIFIPAQKIKKGKYFSTWQLRNDKNQYIGEQVNFNITVVSDEINNLLIPKSEEVDESKNTYADRLIMMKEIFDMTGISDEVMLKALKDTGGNIEEAVILLLK